MGSCRRLGVWNRCVHSVFFFSVLNRKCKCACHYAYISRNFWSKEIHTNVLSLLGQATARLSNFTNVLGIDPSLPMIRAARKENDKRGVWATECTSFIQGSAEDVRGVVEDDSVDMLVSGLVFTPNFLDCSLTSGLMV